VLDDAKRKALPDEEKQMTLYPSSLICNIGYRIETPT
jgi:hypothetical protein